MLMLGHASRKTPTQYAQKCWWRSAPKMDKITPLKAYMDTEIFAFVNTPRKGSRSIRNRPVAFCAQYANMTVEQIMVDLP
eukprot:Skav226481  [mRNA]  locus=scaffold4441:87797:88036:+ [translate_table: standard]